MSRRSDPPGSVLIVPHADPAPGQEVLDRVRHYRYAEFAEALAEAGCPCNLLSAWPETPPGGMILFHTMSIDHAPVASVTARYGDNAAARAVPLQTSLAGAVQSVAHANALGAVENRGYGDWVAGRAKTGTPSGLIVREETAGRAGLSVLETLLGAALVDGTAPLPVLVARLAAALETY
jgi:hypothetical protein